MQARADLHLHSKYSDRPSEWFLRRIGAPESFTEPLEIYRVCKQRGMDFVTIADHNRIDGALAIAHLPGTFLSCETTTYFPEDGCKVHLVLSGLTEAQFHDVQQIRPNVYDLQRYLAQHDIIHAVAHLLYSVNGRLTIDHVERLILMFQRFEIPNGTNNPRADRIARAVLAGLTPDVVQQMAQRQDLAPTHPEPWRKLFTAGSDDHSGLYLANAWTATPQAPSVEQYLDHLRHGRHEPGGASGDSLQLAHAFHQIGFGYYAQRHLQRSARGLAGGLVGQFVKRYLAPPPSPAALVGGRARRGARLGHSVRRLAWRIAKPMVRWRLSKDDRLLFEALSNLLGLDESHPIDPAFVQDTDVARRNFEATCRLAHQLGYRFLQRLAEQFKRGNFVGSLQALASLGPVGMSIAPYVAAFKTFHKDQWLIEAVADHFPSAASFRRPLDRKLWLGRPTPTHPQFTRLFHQLREQAATHHGRLVLLTCDNSPGPGGDDALHFQPVGGLHVPDLFAASLPFPPFLDIIRRIESEDVSELIVYQPDGLGLTGLAAARLLGLRLTGLYPDHLPRQVLEVTLDESLEGMVRQYLRWFYRQCDLVWVAGARSRTALLDEGFDPQQVRVLPDLRAQLPPQQLAELWRPELAAGMTSPVAGRLAPYRRLQPRDRAFMTLEVG